MAYTYQCVDGAEPVSDTFGEQVGNAAQYNVFSGNLATYSAADMVVTSAGGQITHNYIPVTTVSDTVTLVSDPSLPRWSWVARDSTGDLVLVSGDPATIPAVPELGDNVAVALVYIQAAQTIASNCTQKIDKRVPCITAARYKSATQVFSSSTALVDVITSGSSVASFWADAAGIYEATYYVPLAFGGTGGAKFQVSGPAAPTSVDITGEWAENTAANVSISSYPSFMSPFTAVSAFASDIASFSSAASAGGVANKQYANDQPTSVYIRLRLINGSTAGLVTLQAAQNSANSTTTLGIGFTMNVRRIG